MQDDAMQSIAFPPIYFLLPSFRLPVVESSINIIEKKAEHFVLLRCEKLCRGQSGMEILQWVR